MGRVKNGKKEERGVVEVPGKGRDISRESKVEIARRVCEDYETGRYTLESCLKAQGVLSDATWYRWVKEIKEIEGLYKEAQVVREARAKVELTERAMNSLERLVSGYTMELVRRKVAPVGEGGESVVVETEVRQIYIKPEFQAVAYVLENSDMVKFSRVKREEGNEMPEEVRVVIDRVVREPVMREEDIEDIEEEEGGV